jgi:hypothetical protein
MLKSPPCVTPKDSLPTNKAPRKWLRATISHSIKFLCSA